MIFQLNNVYHKSNGKLITYVTIIHITQMMVSKQWVKSWGMYIWAGESCT